jgi:cytochrome c oxidase subunit 2
MFNELMRRILWLPPQASTVAQDLDWLHYIVFLSTIGGSILVFVVGIAFMIRYRRGRPDDNKPGVKPPGIPVVFEATLIVALMIGFVIWWIIGFRQFVEFRVAPEQATEIYVMGKQWMWKFSYPDGSGTVGTLYVPAGQPVKLVMTSRDVLHSFYVPDFRIKQDVLPGRYTTVWFEAKEPGVYDIFCTEYCGMGHSMMRGQVVALAPSDYAKWLEGGRRGQPSKQAYTEPAVVYDFAPKDEVSLVEQGQKAATYYGCVRCHSVDGSPYIGPTWAGMYKAKVRLTSGEEVIADDAYLTRAMMDPLYEVHEGYKPVMPTYQGLLKPGETAAIVEYIRSLKDVSPKYQGEGYEGGQIDPFNDVPVLPSLAPLSQPASAPATQPGSTSTSASSSQATSAPTQPTNLTPPPTPGPR